jgi:hypothetical protein
MGNYEVNFKLKLLDKQKLDFIVLKENVLECFLKFEIDNKTKELIKKKNSLKKLQNYLTSLKKEYQDILINNNIEYKAIKIDSKKNIQKFNNYRIKVINILVHKANLSFERQKELYGFEDKSKFIEFIRKEFNKNEINILKKSKLEPFYDTTLRTNIIYNPMGNKR